MARLYIRELIMRAKAQRIVIVTLGSLVDQWREEMCEKFDVEFCVYREALHQLIRVLELSGGSALAALLANPSAAKPKPYANWFSANIHCVNVSASRRCSR